MRIRRKTIDINPGHYTLEVRCPVWVTPHGLEVGKVEMRRKTRVEITLVGDELEVSALASAVAYGYRSKSPSEFTTAQRDAVSQFLSVFDADEQAVPLAAKESYGPEDN